MAIAYIFIIAVSVPQWIKTTIVWIYIRRNLLPYKIPTWQTFGAPIIAGGIVYLLVSLYLEYVHALYVPFIGPLFAGIVSIVLILVVFPTIVFPLFYGWLGGWDDFGLQTYQKAVSMAGPSKFFFRNASAVTSWAARHSPLTNRFPIPHAEAIEEIRALTEMKIQAQKKV